MRERIEQHPRRIGIIQRNGHIVRMGRRRNRGYILNFHGDGSWAFTPNQRGVIPDQIGNIRTNQRIIRFDLNAKISQ